MSLSALLTGSVAGLAQPREDACADTVVVGRVEHGRRFESALGHGLRIVLDPTTNSANPEGWTIRILGKDGDRDYLMVATPPYRFANPRYLDTSYGTTAEEAVAWSERMFNFVLGDDDFERMNDAIGVLLWPADHDSTRIADAWETTEAVTKSTGILRIVESQTSPPREETPMGRIERIAFEVSICW